MTNYTSQQAIAQAKKHKRPMLIMGWSAMLPFAGFAGFSFTQNMTWGIVLGVAMVLYCMFLLYGANSIVIKFKMFAPLIFEQNITSIPEIAARTGETTETIKVILQGLLAIDALKGITFEWAEVEPKAKTPRSQCPACGANGQSVRCMYCRAMLND